MNTSVENRSFKFACLGTSHPHAKGRVEAMLKLGGELVSIAETDPTADAFSAHFGVPVVSVDQILDDQEIAFVLIHSWTHEMRDLCARAARAGKPVLVEKPGGTGPQDLRELKAEVESAGGVLQVGLNFRHCAVVDRTTRILNSGALGDIVQVRGHGAVSVGEHRTPLTNQPDDIGGALYVIGCHIIDIMLYHFGMPSSVNAQVRKFANLSGNDSREDAAGVILNYPDFVATYDFNALDPLENVETWRVEIFGTKGSLRIGYLPEFMELYVHEETRDFEKGWSTWSPKTFFDAWSGEKTPYSPDIPAVKNTEFFAIEAERFLKAVFEGAPPAIGIDQAIGVADVIAACYASGSQDGAPVYL